MVFVERVLEVKLPTVWAEKKKKIEEEKVRESQKKEDAGARKRSK